MEESSYYREQPLRARRLAKAITDQYAKINLERLATDYSAIAEDIERGAGEVRCAELFPANEDYR